MEETGEILDVSIATISREQRMAEAWLNQLWPAHRIRSPLHFRRSPRQTPIIATRSAFPVPRNLASNRCRKWTRAYTPTCWPPKVTS